jgi:hypothetical protein
MIRRAGLRSPDVWQPYFALLTGGAKDGEDKQSHGIESHGRIRHHSYMYRLKAQRPEVSKTGVYWDGIPRVYRSRASGDETVRAGGRPPMETYEGQGPSTGSALAAWTRTTTLHVLKEIPAMRQASQLLFGLMLLLLRNSPQRRMRGRTQVAPSSSLGIGVPKGLRGR